MSQEHSSSYAGPMLLTFLAGAAVGAVLTALTTPKSGPELRGDLKDLAGRARRRATALANDASEGWEDLKERTNLAAGDLQHGMAEAAKDLRG